MKIKLFMFFVVLMTFTLAWPNAPPVVVDPGITVEFLADNLEIDYDFVTVDAIQTMDILQIELPLEFYVISIPVMTIFMDPGTQGVNNYVNYTMALTQDNLVLNLTQTDILFKDQYIGWILAANQVEVTASEGLLRLDIGEYLLHTLCDN